MKKVLLSLISIILILSVCVGCKPSGPVGGSETPTASRLQTPEGTPVETPEGTPAETPDGTPAETPEGTPVETPEGTPDETPTVTAQATLNGVPLSSYVIIYGQGATDYEKRAAEYIKEQIQARTGITLEVYRDDYGKGEFEHEIVVGETARGISEALDADVDGVEFAIMAQGDHIAMEGDYFVIAAAAYYFVDTYITGEVFDSTVPETVSVCEPIKQEANNYILLIGDGMGLYQTLLFDIMSAASKTNYSDGETEFYGYMLPYMGFARTNSLSGVTDSAAAGTALASGYKTTNGYIGKDHRLQDVPSITEIAAELGKATAVMSTENQLGATPASFSSHAASRNDSTTIFEVQVELMEVKYGTIINCGYDYYTRFQLNSLKLAINNTLEKLSANENGFFIMYEEAHIDKHCHSNDINKTFEAMVRFNQAIGIFMEYAFYNPDTFVLITADHETGGLLPNGSGGYSYSHGNHSAHYVPVFAYGCGGELFDDRVVENIQIPKTIAALWGVEIIGTNNALYPSLIAPKKDAEA